MQSAPSVAFPVARSRRVGWWLALVWGLAALPVAWWFAAVPTAPLVRCLMLLWILALGCGLAWQWWRTDACTMRWDGQTWSIDGKSPLPEACLTVSLDFQTLMLSRLQPAGSRRVRWIFADRSGAPDRWHGLRCAVTAFADQPVRESAPA
jgi:hypothetical protein